MKIWVIEEKYEIDGWWPLVDYVFRKKIYATNRLNLLKEMTTDLKAKYRITKYERRK